MNELSSTIMNKYFKTIASVMVVFALLLSAFATPVATVVAVTSLETPTGWNTPANPDSTTAGVSYTETDYNYVRCVLEANKQLVATGESITLSWQTSGVSDITINGEAVSQTSGTKTITNLQQSTIFTLKAINDAGSSCTQNVVVTCLPPEEPKICELTLTKVVNKSTAVPGDELAYTITVKNIGDGNQRAIEFQLRHNDNRYRYFNQLEFAKVLENKKQEDAEMSPLQTFIDIIFDTREITILEEYSSKIPDEQTRETLVIEGKKAAAIDYLSGLIEAAAKERLKKLDPSDKKAEKPTTER